MTKRNLDQYFRLYVAPPGATAMADYRLDISRQGWDIEELERVERIYKDGGYRTLVLSMVGGIDRVVRGAVLAG